MQGTSHFFYKHHQPANDRTQALEAYPTTSSYCYFRQLKAQREKGVFFQCVGQGAQLPSQGLRAK